MPKSRQNAQVARPDRERPGRNNAASAGADIGARIRLAREQQELSLRRFAAKLDISPSGLSQIETGRSRPSVGTLYAIVSELGISLDDLFSPGRSTELGRVQARLSEAHDVSDREREPSIVQRAGDRKVIELESGVTWERLNPPGERDVEFLEVTYDVGGASRGTGTFVRHSGREYGLVLSGVLKVTVGFEDHELGPGDSISFESSIPHRLENVGKQPVNAVWFVIGRDASDRRAHWAANE